MAVLDLNSCFPEPADGSPQGPLPKQKDFLSAALDVREGAPKYIRYIGGIGAGKTLIGCVTVLCWAVLYEGTYLVGRQFFPELRDTTLETFLSICPKELIVERRVADALIKIRSQNGGVSTILFRQMEEPDKLRSLNLNGFYLDESCQVSEAGFLLLQGRLRGRHVRKGILTTNSDGRGWGWRYFVQKSMFKDKKTADLFLNIRAPSTENKHLPAGYVETLLNSWSEQRIRREILADEEIFEGAVYPEFRRDVHVIPPFAIPKDWTRLVGADHGWTNPTAWVWGAVDPDNNVYLYREYYETGRTIKQIVDDVKALNGSDTLSGIYIDPSTKAVRSQTGSSDWDTYLQHVPQDWPIIPAQNDVEGGLNKVREYLKPGANGKPKLFVFNTLNNWLDEIGEYRYEEQPAHQQGRVNLKEQPRKYKDHLMDATRYLIVSRPEGPKAEDKASHKRNEYGLSGTLQRELHSIKSGGGVQKDPWGEAYEKDPGVNNDF